MKMPDNVYLIIKDLGHEIGVWSYTNITAARNRLARTGGTAYRIEVDTLKEVKL